MIFCFMDGLIVSVILHGALWNYFKWVFQATNTRILWDVIEILSDFRCFLMNTL